MADNTEMKVKALLTNTLLTVIAGLITFFGTITYGVIKGMNDKLDTLTARQIRTEKDVEALKGNVSDQHDELGRLSNDVNYLHTVQEAEADILYKINKSKKQ